MQKGNEKKGVVIPKDLIVKLKWQKNEIWTADTIKQRGLKLLEFMEKRWDISLGDDLAKNTTVRIVFFG